MQVGQKCNIEDMRRAKNTPPLLKIKVSSSVEKIIFYSELLNRCHFKGFSIDGEGKGGRTGNYLHLQN